MPDDTGWDDGGEMPPQQEAGWASPATRPLTAVGASYRYPTEPLTNVVAAARASGARDSSAAMDGRGAGTLAARGDDEDAVAKVDDAAAPAAAAPATTRMGAVGGAGAMGAMGGKIRGEDLAERGIAYYTTLNGGGSPAIADNSGGTMMDVDPGSGWGDDRPVAAVAGSDPSMPDGRVATDGSGL